MTIGDTSSVMGPACHGGGARAASTEICGKRLIRTWLSRGSPHFLVFPDGRAQCTLSADIQL